MLSKQRIILNELSEKYKQCGDVRGILVYGSVAKGLEKEHSDIDLWIYKSTGGFIHRTDTIQGVKVDLFEISIPMLEKFVMGGEAPVINSLLDGKFVYNRDIDEEKLKKSAVEVKNRKFIPIETLPKNRILNVLIQLMNLIDDARDLVDDRLRFRLVFSEVIVGIYNNLYDFYGIWRESPKNTLEVFEEKLPEIYPLLKTMLDDDASPVERVDCADKILNRMAEKYGGIPESHIITEIKE